MEEWNAVRRLSRAGSWRDRPVGGNVKLIGDQSDGLIEDQGWRQRWINREPPIAAVEEMGPAGQLSVAALADRVI